MKRFLHLSQKQNREQSTGLLPTEEDGDFFYSAGRTIPFPAATGAFFLDTLFAGFAGFPTLSRFGRSA